MVKTFCNVTGFSHFTMVKARLVCRVGNGGRIKAKFTIVTDLNQVRLSQVYLKFVFFR